MEICQYRVTSFFPLRRVRRFEHQTARSKVVYINLIIETKQKASVCFCPIETSSFWECCPRSPA
ncbi:hypothetical protein SDJN02_20781, partial [Cucurbita argyrosperma subsp. argyrosperma]